VNVEIDETARKVAVIPRDPYERRQREMWGTLRALIQNHVTGVSEGHIAILRLVGVGYRASIEGNGTIVNLKVQYAHLVELKVPEGVKASTPQPTRILLEGADKEVVKQFAAEIREWRKPEPYKGKVGAFWDIVRGWMTEAVADGVTGHLRQQRDHQAQKQEDQVNYVSGWGEVLLRE
jgi:large subunit ribosomal protein L6